MTKDNTLIQDLRTFKGTLKELSWDKEHRISLVDDEQKNHKLYNMDGIAKQLCRMYGREKLNSCDGYHIAQDGELYLIEFKNQNEGNVDSRDIRNKIFDSISMIVLNENKCRSEICSRMNVIIVYNNSNRKENDGKSYSSSKAMDQFAEKLAGFSGRKGWERFEKKFHIVEHMNSLVQGIYTVDVRDFEREFVPLLFDGTD